MHAILSPRLPRLSPFLALGLVLFALFLGVSPARAQDRIYVNRTLAGGSNDGSSWENAYNAATALQDALVEADSGDEIWVAAGVYTPTSVSGRDATFQLKSGVAIYGGFAGDEESLSARDWQANITVLSGDLDNNDTFKTPTGIVTDTAGLQGGNAYHVVGGSGVTETARLDGVTITAGYADGPWAYPCGARCGGGIYNNSIWGTRPTRPTLANITFSGNYAGDDGGGMYNLSSSPDLNNVTFTGNRAASGNGGGMANLLCAPSLSNVSFHGNRARRGGGMANLDSEPSLMNVAFSGNQAIEGGGLYNNNNSNESRSTLTNVAFSGNYAIHEGGGLYSYVGNFTLTNVTFSGNYAFFYGGGMYISSGAPLLQNSILWGNGISVGGGSQIYNIFGAPTIRYSLVQGGWPSGSVDGGHNLPGTSNPRFVRAPSCGTDGFCTDNPETPAADESADDDYGDLRLQDDSPAIDVGHSAADLDGSGPQTANIAGVPTDLAGLPRIVTRQPMPAVVDLGAYEAPNLPPVFASSAVTTAAEDLSYLYNVSAADPDPLYDDIVTLAAVTLPAWLAFSDAGDGAATLSGTPTNDAIGVHAVVLQATDAGGATATQPFTITVANVNDAPTFTSSPPTSVEEGTAYGYAITTADVDVGDSRIVSVPTLPNWLSFADHGDGRATLSGTPDNAAVGQHPVLLTVLDAGGLRAEQPFTITVVNVNDAPTFTSTPLLAANEDALYSYAITTADVDTGDTRVVSALILPAWLTLDDSGDGTATVTGTPTNDEVGTYPVVLQVTDAVGSSAVQAFTLVVGNAADAPAFTSVPATAATEDQLYLYQVSAADPDAGMLIFVAPQLPDWLSLGDAGNGTATLTGTPSNDQVGEHTVTLAVMDAGGIGATQSFTITVSNVNDVPAFSSSPATVATVGVAYSYAIVTSDPDAGDTYTLTAPTKPNWLAVSDEHDGAATLSGTPTMEDVGTFAVLLQVTDVGGLSAEQPFSLTVVAVAPPPLQLGGIAGVVFGDGDGDEEQDTGEPGLPGVTVTLQDTQARVAELAVQRQTATDTQGVYRFDEVPVGSYVLHFTAPDGYVLPGMDTMGVTVQADQVTTASGCGLVRAHAEGKVYLPQLEQ